MLKKIGYTEILSIITLRINGLNASKKDINCLNGLKNKQTNKKTWPKYMML